MTPGDFGDAGDLYRALTVRMLDLAQRRGSLTSAERVAIERSLKL